jgi:hypothetical protein
MNVGAVTAYRKKLLRCMSLLLALSGQSNRTRVCPLLDQSGQTWILARDGLSAFDPTATLQSGIALLPVRYAAGMWTPLTVTQ